MLRAAVIFIILTSANAFADPAGSGSGSDVVEQPGDKPSIAPPAPDAAPRDVQKAKEIADKAKLTPIIPNPNNPSQPAFQLYAEIDVPVLSVGAVFALSRLIKTQPAYCAPSCTDSGINAIDKLTVGYYSSACRPLRISSSIRSAPRAPRSY